MLECSCVMGNCYRCVDRAGKAPVYELMEEDCHGDVYDFQDILQDVCRDAGIEVTILVADVYDEEPVREIQIPGSILAEALAIELGEMNRKAVA